MPKNVNQFNPFESKMPTTFESMRGLLHDTEAAKEFEKMGLFKTPELLEKYVIASEFTIQVLDVFLSHVFGTERGSAGNSSGDIRGLWESLGWRKGSSSEDSSAHADEPNKEVEGLRVKVENLERQLSAFQRKLQLHGEISQLTEAFDGRLNELARECERQVSAASDDILQRLSEEVSALKEGERRLHQCISRAEEQAQEADSALRDEIQSALRTLDRTMGMILMDPPNGVIAQLTRECGGNVHIKGAVEVTASSFVSANLAAKNVADFGSDWCFQSRNEPNQWICYDFKGRRVAPVGYSIRTGFGYFPKSWVLEVSDDGSDDSWEVVDRRENNEDLDDRDITRNFLITARPPESFRFIRLRQTGKNHDADDFLLLCSFEVFGAISIE